jgi:hypothetical protein
VIGNE